MKTNNKHTPKLRFPEFTGDWEEKKFGEISKSYSGGTPSTTEKKYYNGNIPFIRSAEIGKYYSELFLTSEGLNNSSAKLVNKGDVLVALYGANSGDVAIAKINGAINQAILCLKFEDCNEFVYQFLTLKKEWIISTYLQGGQGNLSGQIIKSVSLPFPSKAEQQKIAACLSSLDERIEAENQKLQALKKHKKGLMQQLFPAQGKTKPELRFKGFKGDWEEKKLGDVGKIITGNTPSTKEREYYDGNRLFVSPADISINRYITKTNTTLTELGFSKTRKIKKNSVLFVCIGSTIGKVAQNKVECATNQQINAIIPFKNYLSDFIYSTLEYNASNIASIAGNQAVPIINKSLFSSVLISVPKDKQEQQKIASCLSSLDEIIELQGKKIEKLQEHKKGLMQQMFP